MSNTPKWTPSQELAIKTKGKTLLISAAAGSGKTATLTERIISSLTDDSSPADISRMLVVTFTVAAASELKQRISAALSKEIAKNPTSKHLSKQLIMLEGAQISTIDSFCFNIVRENFQRIGLPSGIRIADTGELHLLHKNIMEDIIEEHYDSTNTDENDFISFVENFIDTKESDPLSITLLSLYEKLSSREEGIKFIKSCADSLVNDADSDFFLSRQGKIIYDYLFDAFSYYHTALSKACDIICSSPEVQNSYFRSFSYDLTFASDMLNVLNEKNYEMAKEKIGYYSPINLSSLKADYKTEEVEISVRMKKNFLSFVRETATPKYFSLSQSEISQIIKDSAKILYSIYNLLEEFEERSMAEKYRRKIFGFNDITRFAVNILSDENGNPSDVARAYAEKFDEIYIDEYQDVSPIQDYLFRLVSRPDNRFMVGDIKQSIYSFRNAEPEIFSKYKKDFPLIKPENNTLPDSDHASIFMSNNFRCDKTVIDFTNKIFSFLFTHCGGSINYTEDDDLKFSKIDEDRAIPAVPVNVRVLYSETSKNQDDGAYAKTASKSDTANKEAIWVANEIHRLLNEEKKADGSPIEPKDIAILMRQTTSADDFANALDALGIPSTGGEKKDIFNTPDVLLMLSLLSAVDNPQRDITLAATLYSPFFAYTMDDLILIRESADPSCSLFEALENYQSTENKNSEIENKNTYFLKKLLLYRNYANSTSLDKLINFIYNDLSVMSMEYSNSSNLLKLYELARGFESGSFKGLNNFISYINDLIEDDKIPDSLAEEDDSANAVKILTIHKSKGLEFPVCFVSNTQAHFNFKDTQQPILYSSGAGIAFRLAHKSGLAKLNTPLREAVALQITDSQKEEEMRILYVALTRARERLYITANSYGRTSLSTIENKSAEAALFPGAFNLKSANSLISWILAAIYPLESSDSHTFEFINCADVEPKDIYAADSQEIHEEKQVDHKKVEEIRARFDFKYPYEHLNKLPAKLSVSKLTPTVLDDVDNDSVSLESADEAHILEISEFFESKSKQTSADKGTATHLFLQFCDFENASANGIDNELDRLVEKRFISPNVAKLINKKQLEAFFKSDLYRSLSCAEKVYREQRFNILLPASHFTKDESFEQQISDEKILVQGVIDLFFTTPDGKIVLCDYKTDYLTEEERNSAPLAIKKLKERHGEQLSYYSMAIEQLCGKKPDKILIYSLPFGEALEIEL